MPAAERYLVTGGAGFVGANLVRQLHQRGAEVHVLLRPESDAWRLGDLPVARHPTGLDSADSIRGLLLEVQPTVVIHCAAYGAYLGRQTDERRMFETNVLGTRTLLHAAEAISYRAFLNIGSSSEYGQKAHPMAETDVPEPVNPYGVTKVSQTLYCQCYARLSGRPVATVRLFSVYGPYEPAGRLFPNLILAGLDGRPMRLAGGGTQARDFIAAEDVVEGLVRLSRLPDLSGQLVNLGTGRLTTVAQFAELVRELTGGRSPIAYDAVPLKGIENPVWVADLSRLEDRLGWRPSRRLEESLPALIEWYRRHRHLYPAELA